MTFYIKPKTTRIINKNVDTIPWDEAARIYEQAAEQAKELALAEVKHAYDQGYKVRRAEAIRAGGIDESEANYEGDLGFSYKVPTLDPEKLANIRHKAGQAALAEEFIKPYQFKSWGLAVLDQLMAWLKDHKLNTLGSEGTINGLQYLKDNLDPKSEKEMGIYRFLMMDARSSYLEKMGSGEAKKYCTLVPLILYAHKLYNSVEYTRWDRETLKYVVNPALCTAMLTEVDQTIPTSRLLEIRNIGLEVATGVKAGEFRNPATTYGLYRLGGTELGEYNGLVQIMMCQVWAAHPTNRTKYMVLDPMNWDNMPIALSSSSILTSVSVPIKPAAPKQASWDDIL